MKSMSLNNVDRRGFLKTSAFGAAGLLLGFAVPEKNKLAAQLPAPPKYQPSSFIHIGTDERVTLLSPKSEMGQGPTTSLAQILADELDVDWSKVRVELAPVNPQLYGFQGVVGSQSIRTL